MELRLSMLIGVVNVYTDILSPLKGGGSYEELKRLGSNRDALRSCTPSGQNPTVPVLSKLSDRALSESPW